MSEKYLIEREDKYKNSSLLLAYSDSVLFILKSILDDKENFYLEDKYGFIRAYFSITKCFETGQFYYHMWIKPNRIGLEIEPQKYKIFTTKSQLNTLYNLLKLTGNNGKDILHYIEYKR